MNKEPIKKKIPEAGWTGFNKMSDEERHAAALRDPDAQPITPDNIGRLKRTHSLDVLRPGEQTATIVPVVRMRAPGSDFASITAVFRPRNAAVRAQASPAKLPPIMTRSNAVIEAMSRPAFRTRLRAVHGRIATPSRP
jgi:hypothetical protein